MTCLVVMIIFMTDTAKIRRGAQPLDLYDKDAPTTHAFIGCQGEWRVGGAHGQGGLLLGLKGRCL